MAAKKKPTKKKKAPDKLVINVNNNRMVVAEYSGLHAQAVMEIARGLQTNAEALMSLAKTLVGAGVKIEHMIKVDTK